MYGGPVTRCRRSSRRKQGKRAAHDCQMQGRGRAWLPIDAGVKGSPFAPAPVLGGSAAAFPPHPLVAAAPRRGGACGAALVAVRAWPGGSFQGRRSASNRGQVQLSRSRGSRARIPTREGPGAGRSASRAGRSHLVITPVRVPGASRSTFRGRKASWGCDRASTGGHVARPSGVSGGRFGQGSPSAASSRPSSDLIRS